MDLSKKTPLRPPITQLLEIMELSSITTLVQYHLHLYVLKNAR
jgi:hypothetical protein